MRHKRTLFCILFIFLYSVSISLAVPPTTKYQPGTTLDPLCAPGDTNCSIQVLPGQTGNANTFLTTDGSQTAWSAQTFVLGGNFATTGAYTMTLTATGTTALTLPTTGTLATTANINTAVSGTTNYLSKFTGTNSVGNSLIYDDGTNIGINDTSPSSRLTVGGDIRIKAGSGGAIIFADGTFINTSSIPGSAGSLANTSDAIITGDSDANATGDVILKTASNDRLHILNSGNIGINTATPSALFSVGATSPFQVTNLGAVSALSYSGAGTNLTGTAASLTAGNVTTNANLTGHITSTGNATSLGSFTSANLSTALSDETGTGLAVFDTSPVFTTPNIGSATGSISGNAGTATALAATRAIWGQNFNGSGDVSGSLTAVGDITGGASNMTILSGTGASRTMILQTTTSGSTATTALTLNADQSATFAGNISITGNHLFTTAFTNVSGRIGEYDATNRMMLTANQNGSDIQDDGTKPSWGVVMNANSTDTFYIGHRAAAAGASAELGALMTVLGSNGKVGIGTTSPSDKLDVFGTVRASTNTSYYSQLGYTGGTTVSMTSPSSETADNMQFIINGGSAGTAGNAFVFKTQTGNTTPAEMMRITKAGNVGIGTTAPTARFNVGGADPKIVIGSATPNAWYSSGYDVGVLQIGTGVFASRDNQNAGGWSSFNNNAYLDSSSGSWTYMIADEASMIQQIDGYHYFNVAAAGTANTPITWTTAMAISSGGNVGIGTTTFNSFTSGLQIQPSARSKYGVLVTDTDASVSAALYLNGSGGGNLDLSDGAGASKVSISSISDSYFMGGNVGIGTTSPLSTLHVSSANKTLGLSYNTGYGNLFIASSSTTAAINTGGTLAFGGQGRTSGPAEIFSWATISGRKENASDGSPAGYLAFETTNGDTNLLTERMRILSGGQVSIGTTSNSGKLAIVHEGASDKGIYLSNTNVSATGQYAVQFIRNSSEVGSITTTNTATTYATSSDQRLKENIQPTHYSLDDLMNIQVSDFSFIRDTTHTLQNGFIAQQLQTIYPEAVHIGGDDPNTAPWAVDYGRLTPLIIQSIQEMNIQVQGIPTLTDQTLYTKIADFLRGIAEQGTAVIDNITAKFITADSVTSKKVETNELCVKRSDGTNICVTGDQLNTLLNSSGIDSSSSGDSSTLGPTLTIDPTPPDDPGAEDTTLPPQDNPTTNDTSDSGTPPASDPTPTPPTGGQ